MTAGRKAVGPQPQAKMILEAFDYRGVTLDDGMFK